LTDTRRQEADHLLDRQPRLTATVSPDYDHLPVVFQTIHHAAAIADRRADHGTARRDVVARPIQAGRA